MSEPRGLERPLLEAHRFLRRGPVSEENWSQLVAKDRDWETSYRGPVGARQGRALDPRRELHRAPAPGTSTSRTGLITWESQAVDYPSTGPEMPDYEPRGCPRGASFSWYTYSPLRLKYPYVRGSLLEMFREARDAARRPGRRLGGDRRAIRRRSRLYKRQRGKGGFVRASWDEAVEMIAAAHVHTIKRYGPDRVRRLLADPGDVDGLLRRGHPLPVADRRRDPLLLRLVRGPAARLAAGRSATRPTCPSPATGGTPATC